MVHKSARRPRLYRLGCCIVLTLSVLLIHFEDWKLARVHHLARNQFEEGLVHGLTSLHIIQHKPWSQSNELIHSVLRKWNLHRFVSDDLSHYQVIHRFFTDIEKYETMYKQLDIHRIALIINDMHAIIAELDHFESVAVGNALRGFWSKNPFDARVIHAIHTYNAEMSESLYLCLELWRNKHYYNAGKELAFFIANSLHYEETAEEFGAGLWDLQAHDTPVETVVHKTEPKDPLDKWRKKARFRSF